MKYKLKILFVLTLCRTSIVAHADTDFSTANTLIKSQQYAQAYKLLEPIESEQAGNPIYDLLFGIAALETGNTTRATFALERVIEAQPKNTEALALIAKAHFKSGEVQTSKSELQLAIDAGVPAEAKESINRLMGAIDEELDGTKSRIGVFIEFTIGHDSNVNSATSSLQVAIPALGGAIGKLSNSGTKLSSNFTNPAIGINISRELNKSLAIFGGATFIQRTNLQQHSFNTGDQDLILGVSKQAATNIFTVALQGNNFILGDITYRKAYGINGQWQRDINDHDQASSFVQYSRLEYPEQNIRNTDRYIAGVGWVHAFASTSSPVIYGSVYGGEEKERNSEFANFGHGLWGMHAGTEFSALPKTRLFAGISYENRNYDGIEQLWLTSRHDQQWDFNIGARVTPAPSWMIIANLSHTSNNSNVPVSEYGRLQSSINFHHELNW